MNDILQSLLEQLKSTNRQTRAVIGAGLAAVLLIAGVALWRAANPRMTILFQGLDAPTFSKAAEALAQARVRFDTSGAGEPYIIWVAETDRSKAMAAVHAEGAMEAAPLGIVTGGLGMGSAFLGQAERNQTVQKRHWEEAQRQLEAVDWIARASFTSSPQQQGSLRKPAPPTVSAVLHLRGIDFPDREQSMMAARIVRNCFGVPAENVAIIDQRGRRIYDGSRDTILDDALEFEQSFARAKTLAAQRFLDETFGPGLARAQVQAEFNHELVESLNETIEPGKFLLSEEKSKSSTPLGSGRSGGPATTSNGDPTAAAAGAREPEKLATTSEERKQYAPGRKTTYQRQDQPILRRMTVSLVLDQSLADELGEAEEAIKGVVGFDEERDSIYAIAQLLPGFTRDEHGKPLPFEPSAPAEEPNALVVMALERGVEILAAVAFLILLLRTLKKGSSTAAAEAAPAKLDAFRDGEIDMDVLARKHVEELLAREPEKVGALLSRWALGEDFYIRSSR